MTFASRIGLAPLAELCRRLAISLESGVEIRRVWQREAERAVRPGERQAYRTIAEAVARGESLHDAIGRTGQFFPALFRRLVTVGEVTGALPDTFRQLSEHYEQQRHRRRVFWTVLAWPLLELTLAVAIIGFLIWIMGVIGRRGDVTLDPLGFGLVGTPGLIIYLGVVGLIALSVAALVWAVRRQLAWTEPIQILATSAPGLGKILRTLALARLAWTLQLMVRAGVGIGEAVDLALESTNNAYFTRWRRQVREAIGSGESLIDAFTRCPAFPHDFLDAIQTGEDSGRLDDTLASLSGEYNDRATAALGMLNTIGAIAVACLVAAVIIFLIFRLALFYISTIYDALPQ